MTAEPAIQIRRATIDDRDSALTLIEQFVSRGTILSRTLDELEHVLANGYVAVQESRVVGFVTLEIYSQKLAEIRSLVVEDRMQGQGVGRRLVETCVERARERGVFEVMAVSSSEDFFRTCGFDFTLPGEKKAFFLQTRPKFSYALGVCCSFGYAIELVDRPRFGVTRRTTMPTVDRTTLHVPPGQFLTSCDVPAAGGRRRAPWPGIEIVV